LIIQTPSEPLWKPPALQVQCTSEATGADFLRHAARPHYKCFPRKKQSRCSFGGLARVRFSFKARVRFAARPHGDHRYPRATQPRPMNRAAKHNWRYFLARAGLIGAFRPKLTDRSPDGHGQEACPESAKGPARASEFSSWVVCKHS
jgi:hypothetical protein